MTPSGPRRSAAPIQSVRRTPRAAGAAFDLYVVAGVDGAGKTSLAGASLRARGVDYFDPDDAARCLMAADPQLGRAAADGLAALQSERLLARAIAAGRNHAFESTLDAPHLSALLAAAAAGGAAVHVWYAGLASPELHLQRVRRRGRDPVGEADIRRRYRHSRVNLIELLPSLAALRLFDNTADADPARGVAPHPRLLLHLQHGCVVGPDNLSATPEWARPIVAAALRSAA